MVTRRVWLTSCGWNYGMHRHGNRPDVTIWACVFHFCLSYFSDWKTWIEIIGKYIYFLKKNIFFYFTRGEKAPCSLHRNKKKILHFSQRRILFFLGEERDCAAASGGLTFSIPSLKGVWGLWDKDAGVAEQWRRGTRRHGFWRRYTRWGKGERRGVLQIILRRYALNAGKRACPAFLRPERRGGVQ